MAPKKDITNISLESLNPDVRKPRLVKLLVSNYKGIGSTPVEIELDEIVILVGANNVGKSSILQAYKLAMSQGSGSANLTLEDFPNRIIDTGNLPTIEIHTVVYDESVGKSWIDNSTGENIVRERWLWPAPGAPTRQGWDISTAEWSLNVPWGAPNVANSRRPEPHMVGAFSSPEEQAKEIVKLLKQELEARLKVHKDSGDESSEYTKLFQQMATLQVSIVEDAREETDNVNKQLSELVAQVFPGYVVDFDAKPEDNLDKNITFFKADSQLLMGPRDGHLSTIDKQGSGARRTLLWTAIKFLAENTRKSGAGDAQRPHLLLIDEPEICLHPSAIRDARNALYALPGTGKWQVMATTHSPIFIDFSKDNTTIVRVERSINGDIKGTTVFRPQTIELSDNDKENLKMLNICDPYVAEFFFGGRIIIVEGDTEYTAFNYVRSRESESYRDVHIIRARGKATIASLVKILNRFGSTYSILHDSDKQRTKDGKKANPAWGSNTTILNAVNGCAERGNVRLFASIVNFERAYLGVDSTDEKPYKALRAIMDHPETYDKVKAVLDALLDSNNPIPENCVEWHEISDLTSIQSTK